MDCPFCNMDESRIRFSSHHGFAVRDGFPVSPGHTLVIPKLHVASFFDLPSATQSSLWEMVAAVRASLMDEHHPDGFNVGLNDGRCAGQTVMHAHIHIIPRFQDDVTDPRGGVRWILPNKAAYWRGDE